MPQEPQKAPFLIKGKYCGDGGDGGDGGGDGKRPGGGGGNGGGGGGGGGGNGGNGGRLSPDRFDIKSDDGTAPVKLLTKASKNPFGAKDAKENLPRYDGRVEREYW